MPPSEGETFIAEYTVVASREEHKYFPYSGLFYVKRNTFYAASQDSFTKAPAQNPDTFMLLNNIEPVLQGILQRRRGYGVFSQPTTPVAYSLGYSYRSEALLIRSVVFTSPQNVLVTDENGNTVIATLFTPSMGAGPVRMCLSRDFGYFADTVLADNLKWDGTTNANNLSAWGIDINNVPSGASGGPVGPNPPTPPPGSSTGTSKIIINGCPKFCNSTTTSTTSNLTGFGFAVSSTLAINGITVQINAQDTLNSANLQVQLLRNGAPVGNIKSLPITANPGAYLLGSTTDTWGVNWVAADINSANFGVQIIGTTTKYPTVNQSGNGTSIDTITINAVNITVQSGTGGGGGGAPLSVGAPGAGVINLISLIGRIYFYAFHRSSTGHTSDLSSPSIGTGPVTNASIPLSNIPTSQDPQVDTVLILATADGGDETTLYLVASLPNGTSTYNDNTPDALTASNTTGPSLLTNAIYQDTDANGLFHGIADNTPPPTIKFPTKHKGRIYGSIGQTLYFSKNLDDVTTANGLITAKWEEAWPRDFQMDISQFAETIQGILSDGETLWIGTEKCIRRLIGDSPTNFQEPEIEFNETGILNQESWQIVFREGQPVGSMWITPDFRVMGSDFNTYEDVGTPIQDVLNSINPAAVSTIHAKFVSKGPADYYMLYIPTGDNTEPDTVCVFNLRSQTWYIWQPSGDSMTASLFYINAAGAPVWTFVAGSGVIYNWDDTLPRQDRNGNTPIPFFSTAQTSWLDFGDSTIRKVLNQIVILATDPQLDFQIEGATRQSDFDTPVLVLPPTTITTGPFGDLFLGLAGTDTDQRFYRFTFSNPVGLASTATTFLGGYELEVAPIHRF